jgi:hypothetical protein
MLARRTEMSTQNIMIARAIAERLLEAEQAVDAAFEKTASLAAFMPLARQQAQTSAALGQTAFERVSATMQVLSHARAELVQTHHALAEIQEKVGMRPRNFGGFIDKPDKASLEIVTAQAS